MSAGTVLACGPNSLSVNMDDMPQLRLFSSLVTTNFFRHVLPAFQCFIQTKVGKRESL
jgi:hypothetical protein